MMRTIKAYPEFIRPFLAQIADKTELLAVCERANVSPEDMLAHSLSASTDAWACLDDDKPIVIGGCIPTEIGTLLWMMSAPEHLAKHKKWLLRESKEQIERVSDVYGKLFVRLSDREKKSIKWLEWLGFENAGYAGDAFGRRVLQMERQA